MFKNLVLEKVRKICYALLIICLLWGDIQRQSIYASPTVIQDGAIIQDDEIDRVLNRWIEVLAKAANLTSIKPKVYVLASSEINAFATAGGVIVVTSKLIERCQRAEQLLGVLAHELAHVAGGHVLKIDDMIEKSQLASIGGIVLAGVLTILTANPAPFIAGTLGSAQIGERAFLKHSRDHETIADNQGHAYLVKAGIDPSGLAEFLTILDQQHAYRGNPYVVTHPLTPDRIAAMKAQDSKCSKFPTGKETSKPAPISSTPAPARALELSQALSTDCPVTPSAYASEFKRLKVKVMGFMSDLSVLVPLVMKADKSFESTYLKALYYYRKGDIPQSLDLFNQLIKAEPNNLDLKELRGQILFENSRFSAAKEDLKEVVTHNKKAVFSKVLYAHLLVEEAFSSPSKKTAAQEAVSMLKSVKDRLKTEPFYWRLIATAHGLAGQQTEADLALAEEALLLGQTGQALSKTKQALKNKPEQKTITRAKDIKDYAKNTSPS